MQWLWANFLKIVKQANYIAALIDSRLYETNIGTCIGLLWSSILITSTVKINISVANISADPIINTPLGSSHARKVIISAR